MAMPEPRLAPAALVKVDGLTLAHAANACAALFAEGMLTVYEVMERQLVVAALPPNFKCEGSTGNPSFARPAMNLMLFTAKKTTKVG